MQSRFSGLPPVVAAGSAGRASARLGRDQQLTRLVGVTLFAYYPLILGGHHYSIDGIVMFQTAKRLFFHRSLVLDPSVLWGATVIRASKWSLGLTLAYLPLLALASPLFYWVPSLQEIPYNPSLPYNPALYSNLPYLLCSWLNPLITAITGCLVFRLARLLGLTPRWAVAAALAYGVASPAAAYARFDFAQPLAGLPAPPAFPDGGDPRLRLPDPAGVRGTDRLDPGLDALPLPRDEPPSGARARGRSSRPRGNRRRDLFGDQLVQVQRRLDNGLQAAHAPLSRLPLQRHFRA